MKIKTRAAVSRCEAGNLDVQVSVTVEGSGTGYSKEPMLGAVDHALDGARRTVVAVLTEDRKPVRS